MIEPFCVENLAAAVAYPDEGFDRTVVWQSDDLKAVVLAFAEGGELPDHQARVPVTLQVLEGEFEIDYAGETKISPEGTWLYLPRETPHALRARTESKLLLLQLKGA